MFNIQTHSGVNMIHFNTDYEFHRTSGGKTISVTATIEVYDEDDAIPTKKRWAKTSETEQTSFDVHNYSSLTPVETKEIVYTIPEKWQTTETETEQKQNRYRTDTEQTQKHTGTHRNKQKQTETSRNASKNKLKQAETPAKTSKKKILVLTVLVLTVLVLAVLVMTVQVRT